MGPEVTEKHQHLAVMSTGYLQDVATGGPGHSGSRQCFLDYCGTVAIAYWAPDLGPLRVPSGNGGRC